MDNDLFNHLSLYIAAWGWRIMGMIFLTTSLVFFMLKDTALFVSTLCLWFLCEFMAWKRAMELKNKVRDEQ